MEEIKVENQVDEMLEEPSGEDMLLAQIDAFRDKAKQLQTLISAKERKVKELEAMVHATVSMLYSSGAAPQLTSTAGSG